MEIQTTEATGNSDVLPVISTETTETTEQSTAPVVDHAQTTETSEQSLLLVTNMQAAETSLPQVANPQTTENVEQTTLPLEVTSSHETASLDVPNPLPVTNTPTETLDKSTFPPLENIETAESMDKLVMASDVADYSHDNLIASPEIHQGREMRQETAEEEEDVRHILKIIAATGKFWYDWGKLRSMLSVHLMQVISEYPQAKMTTEEQKISLGETYAELVKRLDNALHSFVDGPPFTLQRLSEIILDARILYPNLSKLALALEKNLSVTSTLTISMDPYPSSLITPPNGLNKVTEVPNPNLQLQPGTAMENGALPEAVTATMDEIMTEVEADVSDVMTMDVETAEKPSESSPMTADVVGSGCVLDDQPTGLSKL